MQLRTYAINFYIIHDGNRLKKSLCFNQIWGPWLSSTAGDLQKTFSILSPDDSQIQLMIRATAAKLHQSNSGKHSILVVLPTENDARKWSDTFRTGLPIGVDPLEYISSNLWGAERFGLHAEERHNRLQALNSLAQRSDHSVIFTNLLGLLHRIQPKCISSDWTVTIAEGQEIDIDKLVSTLVDMGYREAPEVVELGAYALRGGILDIYPPRESPCRLEFLGDSIRSIRTFNPENQQSVHHLQRTTIFPCEEYPIEQKSQAQTAQKLFDFFVNSGCNQRERQGIIESIQKGYRPPNFDLFVPVLGDDSNSRSLIQYLREGDYVFWVRPLEQCISDYQKELQRRHEAYLNDIDSGRISISPDLHFSELKKLISIFEDSHFREVKFGDLSSSKNYVAAGLAHPVGMPPPVSKSSPIDNWTEFLNRLKDRDYSIIIIDPSQTHLKRFVNMMKDLSIEVRNDVVSLNEVLLSNNQNGTIVCCFGDLISHFFDETTLTAFIPLRSIFEQTQRPKSINRNSQKLANSIKLFRELAPGDFVVHVHHGIGRYQGLVSLPFDGHQKDFLLIEYAEKDKIYVPVDGFNLIRRYLMTDESTTPTVDKLGSDTWTTKTSKARTAAKDIAEDLLKAHAKRQLAVSNSFSMPSGAYFQFEEEFAFEETPDQITAIQEINSDLSSPKAMDRLLCGDVGFGKTEVAMRAAMRAVTDGFQVAVLVPTTVLCYQHFETFRKRFVNIGINIAQLNRFVSRPEELQVIDGIRNGSIDIVIGTHRLLSKDVSPKKLGLLIVDEEQKFGVMHKEKIKQLQDGVDTLTLSATPIPRTMHLAMLGLRDMSILSHPPPNRRAVRTFVANHDDKLVKEAIENELTRGGQVFFIHNKINNIDNIASWLMGLLGDNTAVKVAHGQMKKHQLEKTIMDFMANKFPVLVCTSIVESGVDMPKVNTLIINNADQFGLSQLYQLKGRVGRGSQQAFAYLLVRNTEKLAEDARKRLETIITHQSLGAGFAIASRDLEIRGAGHLLGRDQSGHLNSIGIDLYTEMLREAIETLDGIERETVADTEIKIPVTACIPRDYIADEKVRLNTYRDMFSASTHEHIEKEWRNIRDRFGLPPDELIRLNRLAHLKLKLRLLGVSGIHRTDFGIIELRFGKLTANLRNGTKKLVEILPSVYQLLNPYRLLINQSIQSRPDNAQQLRFFDEIDSNLEPLLNSISGKEASE